MLRWYLGCVAMGAAASVLLLAGAHNLGWLSNRKTCVEPPPQPPAPCIPPFAYVSPDRAKEGVEALRKHLDVSRWVVFRSNDGIAHRRDDDWEVTFGREPDRRVHILHFGLGLTRAQGTYELSEDGRVTLVGNGANFAQLPELALQSLHGGLFLVPHAELPDAARDARWYFRKLTGEDEQEALSDVFGDRGNEPSADGVNGAAPTSDE